MYWNTYRLSYSGHVIFKVAIKKDNEAYPHINGSMKKLATRAICASHLASYSTQGGVPIIVHPRILASAR